MYIETINSPEDVKKLTIEELPALAEEMAVKETDATRKQELMELAHVCRRVPEYPAESFHEAVQSVWFLHLILQIESSGHSISPGRFDQYMYPYLKMEKSIWRILVIGIIKSGRWKVKNLCMAINLKCLLMKI